MEPEGSSPTLQQLATCPCPEPDDFNEWAYYYFSLNFRRKNKHIALNEYITPPHESLFAVNLLYTFALKNCFILWSNM
jgi:hypothetical protein